MGSGTPLSAEELEQGFRFAILSDAARAFGLLLEAVDASLQGEDSTCCAAFVSLCMPIAIAARRS